ncbi:transcriptional repressor LexA [Nodosilinea sp. P-1105]|uniref:transcriptional repressor LexA n=1 Tax=Nodosilinea sp. P-1105 TaxID=2546229 RepID=UPI00146F0514|nr:transcriptional repressor LexA [Nodosilinea sp. P-1105]NMF81757.1 repressor LexA [Nodosilinea sp. P-1105]
MRLLPEERRLYKVLRQYFDDYGYPPSIRDIKASLEESSTSKVQDGLRSLEQKGLIVRHPRRPRAMRLLSSQVNLKGLIQAGYLTDHPRGHNESIRLDGHRYAPHDYALKVVGDSMVEAHILDGDIVVIRPTTDLWAMRPGNIAVVWIKGEGTTLKRIFYQEGDNQVTLKPANPDHPIRTLKPDQVDLQGLLVGHHRQQDGLWLNVIEVKGYP